MAIATKQKSTSHHKKRSGHHHRKNKPYLKTYWPYIPLLMIVIVGLAINSLWANTATLGTSRDYSHASLLKATNDNRAVAKQAPLTIDPKLTAAAQAKANDLVARDYWAHNSPSGKTPWAFISETGYQYQLAGENLAYGFNSADDAVVGWMNSDSHRANIMNDKYTNVGFGVASSPNYQGQGEQTVIVAEYGRPVEAGATVSTQPTSHVPTASTETVQGEVGVKPVSRVELLTNGQATWSIAVVSAVLGASVAVFVVRHGYRVHRVVSRGEAFIAHHPAIDIVIVFVITASYLLIQGNGIIR